VAAVKVAPSMGPTGRLPTVRFGRWRRLALIGLMQGLWLVRAGAQSPVPGACPPVAQPVPVEQVLAGLHDASDRGFLWRIARDAHVSYLYGTLHIARSNWLLPGPEVVRALGASDTLALELDMLDPDIQRRLAAGMLADPDEHLSATLTARLRAQLQSACLPLEVMARLAPTVQLAALTTLAARWDGLDPAFAIDSFLAGYARALGKAVLSLETPELQIALLKGDAQSAQVMLEHGLGQLEQGQVRPMLVRISQVWDQGRFDELTRYEEWCGCADTEDDRASLKRLLDERNPPLADRIDALHAAGQRVFAAIGALHMVGPLGLPALLAQRGYTVQRIEFAR
jgi:uncharacterized protein YbaP (TraB family)